MGFEVKRHFLLGFLLLTTLFLSWSLFLITGEKNEKLVYAMGREAELSGVLTIKQKRGGRPLLLAELAARVVPQSPPPPPQAPPGPGMH